MSDVLWGVVIGGAIGIVAPIVNMIIGHRRWQCEVRIEFLKGERKRYEELYTKAYSELSTAVAENRYPQTLISDMTVIMRKDISAKYINWIQEKDKDAKKAREFLLEINMMMKGSLKAIDDELRNLILRDNCKVGWLK